jgi:hypothetical protein
MGILGRAYGAVPGTLLPIAYRLLPCTLVRIYCIREHCHAPFVLVFSAESEGSCQTAKGDDCEYDNEDVVFLNSSGGARCQQYEKQKQKQETVIAAMVRNRSYRPSAALKLIVSICHIYTPFLF